MAYYGKREWLVNLRKKKGYSQAMCAAMSGMCQGTLSAIELGYSTPTEGNAQKIADTLGFNVALFREEDEKMRR